MKARIVELETSVTKLEAKNTEFKNEKLTARAEADAAAKIANEAKAEAAKAAGDLESYAAAIAQKHQTEVAELNNQLNNVNAHLHQNVVMSSIADNLVKNGVDIKHHELFKSYFAKAKFDNGTVKFGEADLETAMAEYFTSDAGKHYVNVPMNSGAGATGSTTQSQDPFSNGFNLDVFLTLTKEQQIAAADRFNMPHLKPTI